MRDYMIHEAQTRQAYGRFSGLARLWRDWSLRSQIKPLLDCSDHALREMGLARLQLLQWRDLPWSHDIQWELEKCGLNLNDLALPPRPAQHQPSTHQLPFPAPRG